MREEIINGIKYREVTVRGRTKLISENGDAINPYKRNQKVTIHINPDGYPCFGGGIPVHLYVAYGWVDGYFDGAEVNHKDFDRMNFKASNLEWVTHKQNIEYTIENNYENFCKWRKGEGNGRATFTEEQVREIRNMYDNMGMSVADILKHYHPELQKASQYKNLHSTYLNICKRNTWKHLD